MPTRTKPSRPERINRIARRLADRYERQAFALGGRSRRPLARRERKARLRKLIAYDLETTRIEAGSPRPLYLTAHAADWQASIPIRDIPHLAEVLETRMLTIDNHRARFVAWNGNNFDVFFIASALLHTDRYVLRPYMTRSKNLRGLNIIAKDRHTDKGKPLTWEFLDGISMTGLTGTTLKTFLSKFAPDYAKLEAPDWNAEEFNPNNPAHVAYAERDSEGLYHAIQRFESLAMEHFGIGLQATIGNMGIKILQAHMPGEVTIWEPPLDVLRITRDYVMRGGFCYCSRRYAGPIWKYDINQAYAAAMRDARLPAGRCIHAKQPHRYASVYIVRVRGFNPHSLAPFYYRGLDRVARFDLQRIEDTWITSIEHKQLLSEGWQLDILDCYYWDEHFSFTEYVNKLEQIRINADGGPSGPLGTIVKAIGNNSYGKTVETLDGIELLFANDCPEGFQHYQSEDDALQHVFFRFQKPQLREYHQPQLGAFITAHVRMVVRRAILVNPAAWLYADTDCVIFDRPVTLPIDAKKYGMWKIESEGEFYRIITKKVYANKDASVKHAKGLNVRYLSADDFESWYEGTSPRQRQIQRNNFLKVMTGSDMFVEREKVGQKQLLTGRKKQA